MRSQEQTELPLILIKKWIFECSTQMYYVRYFFSRNVERDMLRLLQNKLNCFKR